MMDWNEYQNWVRTKMARDLPSDVALAVWALGLTGESGEVADLIKKYLGHGHSLDRDKLVKELGDVLYYLVAVADNQCIDLQEVMEKNVEKLNKRYPNGFSMEASLKRVDVIQSSILGRKVLSETENI
jgi:NTP pyrophosphatase (non-canonical NTP hydrolase)